MVARQKALDRDLKKLERRIREEEGRGTEEATAKDVAGREDFLTSSNERRESIRRQVDTVRSTAKALRRLLSGRSPQVTVSGPRVHFADVKLPVKVYEGDRVTISLIEEDAFGHDLMGRKTIVLDQRVLDRGRLELSTGWVELLHLQLVRVE